eukprot:377268-Pelagomonas_calceolata.AAC.2
MGYQGNPSLKAESRQHVRHESVEFQTKLVASLSLNADQRHVHLIEIKYCEDTRPGRQLEAPQRQHADLCKNINAKVVTLHTIL